MNHTALGFGKLIHQPEQPGAVFHGAHVRRSAWIVRLAAHGVFARRALRAIDDGVRGDSQQPCCERNAAPFITL